jgi:hypothetical protein
LVPSLSLICQTFADLTDCGLKAVAITIANGVETAAPLKTASVYHVEYLSPLKHVRSRVQDVDGDCP